MEKELITCAEYAKRKGIPLVTVRGYCRKGIVPHLKIGKTYMLDPMLVDEALVQIMRENVEYRHNGIKRTVRKKNFDYEAALKAL